MTPASALLAAYDEQLRTDAETRGAIAVQTRGPLRLATFGGGYGFVTYRDLDGARGSDYRTLVRDALAWFLTDPLVATIEWKTRGHDRTPGLHEALLAEGFVKGESESIMLGQASVLATEVALPMGVTLRRIETRDEILEMARMQSEVFDGYEPASVTCELMERLARAEGTEIWIAEAEGKIVCSGRLEPVMNTQFAGIWGGATRTEWRSKGIYRALTAARARSALSMGKTMIHSDSTEFSRPIQERAGLIKVSETTPYIYSRSEA